uniref:dephospho-CoA kinase n=1 Tax=Nocardia takedensis TaxID=259390 RepID=UPI0002D6B3B3|nr:dephospho-CoA kinase [Nocardia takedensis]
MLRIGLTGGMGAGKSTVARILAERGAVIVDSDVIAREVVAPGTEGLAALVAAFGPEILDADGALDRPALAARAFADDESRATLNSITHPLVGRRTTELIAAAAPDAIVVQDIPLLVENNLAPFMNLVLVVDVPAETRLRRLVEFRGVDEGDAKARIAAQATDEQRRLVADVLLDNSGPEGAVEPVLAALWDDRLVPFERNLRAGTPAPAEATVVAADPEWPAQARRLIARLWVACGANATRIDHVGATAVPGRAAPDLLEIQITVADAAHVDSVRAALGGAGFPALPAGTVPAAKSESSGTGSSEPSDAGLSDAGLSDAGLSDAESSDAEAARDRPAESWHGNADPGRPATVVVRVQGSPAQVAASAETG